MNVSVIIPTYNRLQALLQALRSLQEQTLPRFGIVVVDNDADPEVERMVGEFNRTARLPVRYVPEPKLGLHHARHAGARAATGEILVFTDDDATFDSGWVQAYVNAFAEHPEMAAAGGPVRPIWEVPPPRWLLDFIGEAKMFGPLSLMEPYHEFRLDSKILFFGVNMAIRRNVLFEAGGFNPELIGSFTVGDGESGLNRKLWERGSRVGYVPGALVYHHIPPARMTVDYLCRWQGHLAGAQLYSQYHAHMPSHAGLALDALREGFSFSTKWVPAACAGSRTDPRSISLRLERALGYARFRYILRLIYDRDLRELVARQDWLNAPAMMSAGLLCR